MSALYGKAKTEILSQARNLTSGTIYALPVTAGYSPDFTSTNPTLADIPTGARAVAAAAAQSLGARTIAQAGANASFDGGDVTFTAVGAGDPIVAIVLMDGTSSGARLIAYIDDLTNLPLTPDGRNIQITWNNPLMVM